jgi:hypothetical protein
MPAALVGPTPLAYDGKTYVCIVVESERRQCLGAAMNTRAVHVFAPDRGVLKWIRDELAGEAFAIETHESIPDLVMRIVTEPTPGPDVAIVDYTAMRLADIDELGSLRETAWGGMLIALGAVTIQTRRRMGAAHIVERPFGSEALRKLVTEAEHEVPTSRISKLEI